MADWIETAPVDTREEVRDSLSIHLRIRSMWKHRPYLSQCWDLSGHSKNLRGAGRRTRRPVGP